MKHLQLLFEDFDVPLGTAPLKNVAQALTLWLGSSLDNVRVLMLRKPDVLVPSSNYGSIGIVMPNLVVKAANASTVPF
jgi:hypothetical protein